MKKSFIITLLISVAIIFTMLSCEQPNNTIPVQEYSTPTIKGTVSIPEGKNVNPGDIYVKVIDSNDKTVTVQKVNPDKTFVVQGLSSDMLYSILFTSVEPDFANRDISRDPVKSNGVGGWIHAIQPAIKEGNNVGNVKMKPLGTIRGKALIDGKAEHYDTTVYIPGTSYIAMTSADGTFAIYNVPEGTYTLRYTHDGYMPIMNEGVILTCPEDAENPEITTRDVKLISSEGTVEGVAKLGDANDSSVVSVRLENEDKCIVYSSTSSKEGNYVINNVTPGKYRIIASASGYISQSSQYFTVAPATLTKVQENLVLYGNIGTVTGTVHLSDSDDKSGIAILISDINSDNSYTVMSDENGSFQKIVKPGSYKVSASYPGYTTITQEIVVAENTSTSVSFTALLPDSGTITGYSNSAEEQVTVIAQDGTPVATILSGLDKSYRFEKIPTGTYSVKFSKTGFASYTANDVKVAPAGTVTVNGEALKSAYGTISGTSASAEESVSLLKGGTVMDTVKTTSDRSYTFTGLEPGKYSVRFSKSGYSSYDSEEVTVSEGSRLTVNGNALVSLFGSVSGKSAGAGETVYLVRNGVQIKTVTTLENREYSFSDVMPGEYTVRFSKIGYSDYESGKITVAAGGSYVVDGQTLVSLYGSVYGTSNSEGETVSLMQGSAAVQTVTTGATKKYRFDNIQPGTYTVRFEKHACVAYTSSEVSVIAGSSVEVNGNRLSSSYGTVTGRSASAGEQISLVGSDGVPVQNTESGSDGTYRFEEVLPGTYSVKFSKAGFASYTANDVKVAPAGTVTVNGEALKRAYGTISGTSAGEGESVSLIRGGVVIETVTVNASKQYIFTGIAPGTYSVRFSREGYSSYESDLISLVAGSEITINGKTLISIHGSVKGLSSSSGEVVSLIKNGTVLKTVVTSQDRSYRFELVEPGTYNVRFSKEGYTPYDSEGVNVSAGKEAIVNGNTLVSKYGTIKGVSASSDETVYLVRDGVQIQTKTTLENREYIFSEITPGEYSVRFTKSGYKAYESDVVTVVAGESYVVDGQKLEGLYGAVAGHVLLSDTNDYSGVVITLTNSSVMTQSLSEISASDGSFRFDNITTPGTYLLTYSKDGYIKNQSKSVQVILGSVAVAQTVTLKSTTSTVKGIVTLDGYTSHENISILLNNDNNQYTATTDQKGNYLINRVLPGSYSLIASKDGFITSQSVNIVIEPSVDKQLEPLSLAVAVKSITGSVELELANDYSGVLVTATNLRDNKLVYSAISNSNGAFTLAGMKSGEYSIVLSCGGYNSITLPTVNVSGTTVFNLDKQYMEISRGRIAGLVRLEGYSDHSGVKVSMLGTDYVTTTASDGSFEFNVPAANYPGGLRFEKEDMETTAYTETIPVIVNSTYALKRDISMSAVNVPVVKGIVKVGGTSDWSGVTVRLVERPEYTVVTGSDGTWCFEHVPLGKYTLEYTRENAKKITSVLNVPAGPIVVAPTLTIIPDSASIEGHISLDSVSDYSGITVKVSTSSVSKEYTATTDSAGYFYIGNLLSSGTHTVTIEKAGWNSKSIVLSNLEPLSLTDISATSSIVLTDTRAPEIKSVSINGGANSTGSRKVNITVNTFEEGSGTALVQYTWTNSFEASSWLNYASSFDVTIPDEVNGTKTLKLRVKDNAGNESSIVSDSIDLVGQIQSIGGTLSVDDLHWVKENNPYVITSDLIIPEGRTLEIDPGVDVLFDGNYSILIRGTLSAVGTENDPIVFRSTRDYMTTEYDDESYSGYYGNWGGISAGSNSFSVNTDNYDFELNYGSEMTYCNIQDIGTGIRGNIYVSNCNVISDRYAIGDHENRFTGALLNSRIAGSAFLGENPVIFGNEFTASDETVVVPSHAHYESAGNYYRWYNAQGMSEYYYVDTHQYDGYDEQGKRYITFYNRLENNYCHLFINNRITGYLFYINIGDSINKIQFITFEDCKFKTDNSNPVWEYCEFINNQGTFEIGNFSGIRFSNFKNNTNRYLLKTNSRYTQRSTHDMRFNYWDSAHTKHLDSISNSSNPNVDFFYDGIDNINLSVINYSGYVSSPWSMAGYRGDKFCDVQATYEKQGEYDEAKVGSNIDINLDLLTDGSISYYRVAQSLADLISSGWTPYYGSAYFSGQSVDYDKLDNGYLDFYLQVKTSDDVESPIKNLSVGYDIPTLTNLSIKDGDVISRDNKISLNFNAKNAGGSYLYIYYYIDDQLVYDSSLWVGPNEVSNIIDPLKLMNGEHSLSIVLHDTLGDSSETVLNFTIDRPLPVVTDLSLENEVLAKDEELSLSVSATNTKHLKQIIIFMDGVQIGYQDYEDNGSSNVIEEFSVEPQYLKDGTHYLYVVLEDYTGNTTTSESVSIEVQSDNSTPPAISFTGFNNGTVFTNNDIESYSMTVSDEGGVSSVDIVLDGVTSLYHFSDQIFRDAYKNLEVKWRLRIPYYKNGNHTITITATDFAGNTSEELISFSVSREVPEIYINYLIDNSDSKYWDYKINPDLSWIYDGGIYIDGVLYSYCFINAGDTSADSLGYGYVYNHMLREGSHSAQYKARLQSGEIIESETFTVTGLIPESKHDYGEGVTWNHNGTLLKDLYTYYLWNFDSSDRAKEAVTGKRLGSVSETVAGFGDRAAEFNLDLSNMKIQFPNNSWTMEFWYNNTNPSSSSNSRIVLRDILDMYLNKRSTYEVSYLESNYYYQSFQNDNSSNDWTTTGFSRDDASSWHHYALVSDGSSFMIYIDGMMRYKSDGDKPSVKFSDGLLINMPEKAYIDELRISNKARSADELWAYNEFVRKGKLIPQ